MYKATVIISINNEFELTENFITNLINITSNDIQKILVIDGIADSRTVEYLINIENKNNEFKCIFLKNNVGYSIANNIGVEYSKSNLLIFLNSDTFPINDSLYQMISYMNNHKEVGVAQGLILYPQTLKVQSIGHIFSTYQSTHALDGADTNNKLVSQEHERQALGSGFYITRKKLFIEKGGFDEFYYNAWEGLEYSLKLHIDGYKCMYIPYAQAYHVKGSGRTRMVRDESYQSGYFWTKWGNYIKEDISSIYLEQLSSNFFNYSYIIVHASSMKYNAWDTFIKKLNINQILRTEIKLSLLKPSISLEDSLSINIIESHYPIIFLTDHYINIINNKRIFKYRNNEKDVIFDLKGNIIFPYQK